MAHKSVRIRVLRRKLDNVALHRGRMRPENTHSYLRTTAPSWRERMLAALTGGTD